MQREHAQTKQNFQLIFQLEQELSIRFVKLIIPLIKNQVPKRFH
jgi:hypothetical protein